MKEMNRRLDNIEREVAAIKSELHEIKKSILNKADKEEIRGLEIRIHKIEQHLKLGV